ncbi:hypothetical protein KBA01_28090 [Kozakia baliensis]|nr:hypothetical protein KBA01_28090 [Kozakia baliensis]
MKGTVFLVIDGMWLQRVTDYAQTLNKFTTHSSHIGKLDSLGLKRPRRPTNDMTQFGRILLQPDMTWVLLCLFEW